VYSARGAGDTALVFIHGGLADREFWAPQLSALADRFRFGGDRPECVYCRRSADRRVGSPFSHREGIMRSFCLLVVSGLLIAAPALAGDAAQVEKGKSLFAAQKCSLCHSVAGKGNAKGSLDEIGSKLKADEIRQWLVSPKEMAEKAKATRKPPMQSYEKLAKADLDALVAYLESLKKK
jgi:mono/diheme cytochrome c family protein